MKKLTSTMSVKELIDKLELIADKNKPVYFSGEAALRRFEWHENVIDHPHMIVFRN
jgi:hypothetical protein